MSKLEGLHWTWKRTKIIQLKRTRSSRCSAGARNYNSYLFLRSRFTVWVTWLGSVTSWRAGLADLLHRFRPAGCLTASVQDPAYELLIRCVRSPPPSHVTRNTGILLVSQQVTWPKFGPPIGRQLLSFGCLASTAAGSSFPFTPFMWLLSLFCYYFFI